MKFFEDGKFYKFSSLNSMQEFSKSNPTNAKIALFIGMNPFEVEVEFNGHSERVTKIRLIDHNDFVDLCQVTGSLGAINCVFFASPCAAHEFNYFIEVAETCPSPEYEAPPIPEYRWKVLIIEDGKLVVRSKHTSREGAHKEATRLILTGTYKECYLLEGKMEKFTVTKKVEVGNI